MRCRRGRRRRTEEAEWNHVAETSDCLLSRRSHHSRVWLQQLTLDKRAVHVNLCFRLFTHSGCVGQDSLPLTLQPWEQEEGYIRNE